MKYFPLYEQECKCCGLTINNPVLNDMIVKARILADIPFVVTSWTRCEEHNLAVGGSKTSSHLRGQAIDIQFKNSIDLFKIVSALIAVGFERVGINYKSKFVHLDISQDKISPVLFTY